MSLPLLLSVYYSTAIRPQQYRVSQHPDISRYPFYCTGTAVHFALVVDPRGGFVGWDPCCCNQQS